MSRLIFRGKRRPRGKNNCRCTEDVLGVSTDLRNGPQQQLVTPRLGIVGDDLDDFEAVVDQKLLVFPIVVDGEQGIALIGSEIN